MTPKCKYWKQNNFFRDFWILMLYLYILGVSAFLMPEEHTFRRPFE